jgi:hypothetical protein
MGIGETNKGSEFKVQRFRVQGSKVKVYGFDF